MFRNTIFTLCFGLITTLLSCGTDHGDNASLHADAPANSLPKLAGSDARYTKVQYDLAMALSLKAFSEDKEISARKSALEKSGYSVAKPVAVPLRWVSTTGPVRANEKAEWYHYLEFLVVAPAHSEKLNAAALTGLASADFAGTYASGVWIESGEKTESISGIDKAPSAANAMAAFQKSKSVQKELQEHQAKISNLSSVTKAVLLCKFDGTTTYIVYRVDSDANTKASMPVGWDVREVTFDGKSAPKVIESTTFLQPGEYG